MQKTVYYFNKPGPDNTAQCLDIVKDNITACGYRHVIVATTGGSTGVLFAEALKGTNVNLVVVTHSYGFKEPNSIELTLEAREKILAAGASIYTGTMITHSLETALAVKFSGVYPTLLVAQSLRRFGEGAKVCCEMIMMAADAGLVPEGEEVLAVAGTGRGADTVTVIRSAASKRFLELKVLEILAKPRT
ncbi:MAG: pyruvate kinase alpha/beta domain-containing protein [Nitrospirota bacterium]